MGYKGSKERTGSNKKQFRENYDNINWRNKNHQDKTIIKKDNKTKITYK